tara:strand:- start:456 stop:824 length:369 start_codon:yes stop_codon:yes gene_type:complete
MLTLEEVRALGEVLNTTWGRSSSNMKVTHRLEGDNLDLQIQSIVHFDGSRSLNPQVLREREIANAIFTDALKKVKADFKDATGRALTVKEISRDDDIELIQATSVSPRKVAYFRCQLRLQVS